LLQYCDLKKQRLAHFEGINLYTNVASNIAKINQIIFPISECFGNQNNQKIPNAVYPEVPIFDIWQNHLIW